MLDAENRLLDQTWAADLIDLELEGFWLLDIVTPTTIPTMASMIWSQHIQDVNGGPKGYMLISERGTVSS